MINVKFLAISSIMFLKDEAIDINGFSMVWSNRSTVFDIILPISTVHS